MRAKTLKNLLNRYPEKRVVIQAGDYIFYQFEIEYNGTVYIIKTGASNGREKNEHS
ncbi:hypothetical protein LCGC14_2445240 [marine sediment metagenome]|uniref:Uncharacterized protein n=1 Tax=marine sediment metagenome TaxID=412755 RepID=A0A0F9BI01_9ZZZZ